MRQYAEFSLREALLGERERAHLPKAAAQERERRVSGRLPISTRYQGVPLRQRTGALFPRDTEWSGEVRNKHGSEKECGERQHGHHVRGAWEPQELDTGVQTWVRVSSGGSGMRQIRVT